MGGGWGVSGQPPIVRSVRIRRRRGVPVRRIGRWPFVIRREVLVTVTSAVGRHAAGGEGHGGEFQCLAEPVLCALHEQGVIGRRRQLLFRNDEQDQSAFDRRNGGGNVTFGPDQGDAPGVQTGHAQGLGETHRQQGIERDVPIAVGGIGIDCRRGGRRLEGGERGPGGVLAIGGEVPAVGIVELGARDGPAVIADPAPEEHAVARQERREMTEPRRIEPGIKGLGAAARIKALGVVMSEAARIQPAGDEHAAVGENGAAVMAAGDELYSKGCIGVRTQRIEELRYTHGRAIAIPTTDDQDPSVGQAGSRCDRHGRV